MYTTYGILCCTSPKFLTRLIRSFSQKACFSTQGSKLIINAVGQDRVGIVSDVAGVVIDAGGNVGDSNAARLGDNFSLMMLVTVPEDKLDHLKARLSALSDVSAAIFAAADISDTARVAGCKLPWCGS